MRILRRCPNCEEYASDHDALCISCQYTDPAWQELLSRRLRLDIQPPAQPTEVKGFTFAPMRKFESPLHLFTVPISSFTDSAELAYELHKLEDLSNQGIDPKRIDLRFDFTPMLFDWESTGNEEEFDFIPGRIGMLALTDACRAICTAKLKFPETRISALFPPTSHPFNELLKAVIPNSLIHEFHYLNSIATEQIGSVDSVGLDLEIVVPYTQVGPSTSGQLSNTFHHQYDILAEKGSIGNDYRSPIRQVIMGLAENGSEYGNGGYIGCFLRQEKGKPTSIGKRTDDFPFEPRQHTHLFINCFTLGKSLAEVTKHAHEWESAQAVLGGFTSRVDGGGSGMQNVMQTVIESAKGSVFVNSKNYVRLVLPNGMVHEYTQGGDLYLPGVHFCLVIPLAVVSELGRARSA